MAPFQPGQRGPGRGGARRKPPLDLPALVVPDGMELAEHAVSIREASELMEVSFQSVHQMIERHAAGQPGGIPGYLHEGRKFVQIDDVADSQASRRLRVRLDEIEYARTQADYYRAHPDPSMSPAWQTWLIALWEVRASGQADEETELLWRSKELHLEPMDLPVDRHPAWCRVCWPEAAEFDRLGNEPAPGSSKRPVSDKRRAQLARARAIKEASAGRRRLARAALEGP